MQNFPYFDERQYVKTRRQIHSLAELIGKFRERLVKPIAKNDNLFLTVVEQGFCTPPMGDYKELEIGCNPLKGIIEIANSSGKYKSVEFSGKTLGSLCGELTGLLSAEFGVNVEIDISSLNPDKVINVSVQESQDFLAQFFNFNTILKDFHKGIISGVKTPICLWPHNFDNAFKWFSGKKIDDADEFMGIGASNGDEMHELPYVYVSLWPPLRKTNTLEIPEGAVLHDLEWTGFILPYESLIVKETASGQEIIVKKFLEVSFNSIQRGFSKR